VPFAREPRRHDASRSRSTPATAALRISPRAVVRSRTSRVQTLFAVARELGLPVTFRAAGTSLSGQTVGEGSSPTSPAFLRSRYSTQVPGQDPARTDRGDGQRMLSPTGERSARSGLDARGAHRWHRRHTRADDHRRQADTYNTMESVASYSRTAASSTSAAGEHERSGTSSRVAHGSRATHEPVRRRARGVDQQEVLHQVRHGYGINALIDFDDPWRSCHCSSARRHARVHLEVVLRTVPLEPERSSALFLFDCLESMARAVVS